MILIKKKTDLLFILFFFILFLSYTTNLWKVSYEYEFYNMDWYDETNIYGRLARSEKDGIFSYGGLTGKNIAPTDDNDHYLEQCRNQYFYYIANEPFEGDFIAYCSQPGGQGILYSTLSKLLPFSASIKVKIYLAINSALVAFCFILLLGWVLRNYNFTTTIVTFLLIFLSPWINNFAHNLWWSLWSFFIPFLSMLLYLERCKKDPSKYSNRKLFFILFLAVLIKCFITGFEFISTTLLASLCPLVYFWILEKRKFRDLVKSSLIAGSAIFFAIIITILILIIQIRALLGSYKDGINHLVYSFIKRTSFNQVETDIDTVYTNHGIGDILSIYLKGNAFRFGFLNNEGYSFNFFCFVLILVICAGIIIYISRKSNANIKNNDKALLITAFFSILSPLSWLILFRQHAYIHVFLDYIVWYIPFLLYVFVIIGYTIHLIFSKFKIYFKKK